jgi:hypothetical protein
MDKAKKIIIDYITEYSSVAQEHVLKNIHMNDLNEDQYIEDNIIKVILEKILNTVEKQNFSAAKSKIGLIEKTREVITPLRNDFENIDQKIVDSILVDFINYVGVKQFIDYSMYTEDLLQP